MILLAILSVSCKVLPFEAQILSYDGNKVGRTSVPSGGTVTVTLPVANQMTFAAPLSKMMRYRCWSSENFK